jgi:hypothetical protein
LWKKMAGASDGLDRYATLRSRETAVVIFEPRTTTAAAPEGGR